jgi:hypothetical protein
MGSFKKVKSSTTLSPGMRIREFNKHNGTYDNYTIGKHILEDDKYEVYPDGKDFLNSSGVLFYYSQSKMINRACEFYDE